MITLYTLLHIINIKQMSNRKLVVDGTARYQPLIFTVDYFILLWLTCRHPGSFSPWWFFGLIAFAYCRVYNSLAWHGLSFSLVPGSVVEDTVEAGGPCFTVSSEVMAPNKGLQMDSERLQECARTLLPAEMNTERFGKMDWWWDAHAQHLPDMSNIYSNITWDYLGIQWYSALKRSGN